MNTLRSYLLAGVVALTPLLVVVALVDWLITLSDRVLALLPPPYRPEIVLGIDLPGIGILLSLLFILLAGAITTHVIGRRLMRLVDLIMERIPLIRTVYKAVRQLLEAMFSDQSGAFQQVVMVPFPNRDSLTLGFVTGVDTAPAHAETSKRVSVFIPSTPLPTTGWLLFVEPSTLVYLEMSVEEGMKWVLSGGVVPHEQVNPPRIDKS